MAVSENSFKLVWQNLTASLQQPVICEKWGEKIVSHYGEEQRHYHTITHVEDMLALRSDYRDQINDVDTVDYAVIFHE